MRDISMVLERWGAWAASGKSNHGYPRTAAGLSRLLPASRAGRVSCCDDDGMQLNEAMIRLSKKDEYLCSLIEWYYIDNLNLRVMGKKLGISYNTVAMRLQTAEGFIDGCLWALDIRLEMDRECRKESIVAFELKKVAS
ncbi:antitermination protein [Rouxiella badensis]|uniref:Antitermination protein n=1 Tax=Rouxiella silvae TaxID=1646373 RepID=A0AA41BXS8_9GAMM|nr:MULTISPECIES: antiterminator Q family protein [Rouxiella]KAB7896426.1 antitermination protein [Rouxiella sp. S1S-2]MBF6637888.1 antitermination protein [Rouxiella silvae]MCC3735470.1 antitermination protein [Rouxiella badensis]MCC3760767.1 antitermination protein [Rouxiella badensis]